MHVQIHTAIEQPLNEDRSTNGLSWGIADTFTPSLRRASVMLNSGGSNVVWAHVPVPRIASVAIERTRIVGEEKWQGQLDKRVKREIPAVSKKRQDPRKGQRSARKGKKQNGSRISNNNRYAQGARLLIFGRKDKRRSDGAYRRIVTRFSAIKLTSATQSSYVQNQRPS